MYLSERLSRHFLRTFHALSGWAELRKVQLIEQSSWFIRAQLAFLKLYTVRFRVFFREKEVLIEKVKGKWSDLQMEWGSKTFRFSREVSELLRRTSRVLPFLWVGQKMSWDKDRLLKELMKACSIGTELQEFSQSAWGRLRSPVLRENHASYPRATRPNQIDVFLTAESIKWGLKSWNWVEPGFIFKKLNFSLKMGYFLMFFEYLAMFLFIKFLKNLLIDKIKCAA